MKYYSLGSGSSGNATLIEHQGHLILVDNGLTIKDFKEKVNKLNFQVEQVEAVLVTHKHQDHIKSIKMFDSNIRYGFFGSTDMPAKNYLTPYKKINIAGFEITPIMASHDVETLNYLIEVNDESLGYVTDSGYISQKNLKYLVNKDYYFFESNHDIKMLMETNRPYYLKNRILSDQGHLSNVDASEYLMKIIGERTKEIVLAHLSNDANTPSLALNTLKEIAKKRNKDLTNIRIDTASRYGITIGGKND